MLGNSVRLTGDNGRRLELTIGDQIASARVDNCEPFPFSFEHLGFVSNGLVYQAWGSGSHFVVRKSRHGFSFEFQGSQDRSPAMCHLSEAELRAMIADLEALTQGKPRAVVL